jgi:endonuclease G
MTRIGRCAGVIAFAVSAVVATPRFEARAADAADASPCQEIWQAIGLPEGAADNDTTYVCHLGYVVEHNNSRKTPDWVIERLTRKVVTGSHDRPGVKFKADPALREDSAARPPDYEKSGYAIGHQAPSADFKSSDELMRDTFFLSNAVPQEGLGFNTGVWSGLERSVQTLAKNRDVLFVITGPVYQQRRAVKIRRESDACHAEIQLVSLDDKAICPARNADGSSSCPNGVAVPAALYKIIYEPRNGRLHAFLLPNIDHRPLKKTLGNDAYLKQYRVGLNSIEALTGYQFFTELPDRRRKQLRETCVDLPRH